MVANVIERLDWDLQEALDHCGKGFSGKLHIRSNLGYEWCFHFFMGRIVGESSGVHTGRRWQRLLRRHPDLVGKVEAEEFWRDSAAVLERMVKRGEITREQALTWSRTSLLESMFDILQLQWLCQQSEHSRLYFHLAVESDPQKGILPWIFFRVPELYHEALTQFFLWQQRHLGRLSPNLAPTMKGLIPLNASAPEKNLLALVDGERTVRDLACQLDQEPIEVMALLMPFVERGIVALRAIPDCITPKREQTPLVPIKPAAKPLIAHIDDNPIEGKLMGSIVQELGCDYLGINEPLKALPELLKTLSHKAKPALVFLDLVMPIVSGYEICAQLRRVPAFAETPIIILTANDGIVDRVRSKVVGATEFVSKPINQEKIAQLLDKYKVVSSNNREPHLQLSTQFI
ncbi:MAG: response regulator [Pseudanabaenaceae cyanobacterium SKYGB_i_bin29]|nr:response regulator [Pseudanabaenaceae cyanobacterium SKYG29]MDW8421190.1 response regulator [Pseudanabaenaceae cyanobacterium SKYGB_i_bin29]